jgi:hypothetical protein
MEFETGVWFSNFPPKQFGTQDCEFFKNWGYPEVNNL